MIALCQIATRDNCYLIDPFPLYDSICDKLVGLLENASHLKIMHGCSNDILAFNRDFGGNIVAVIDTQVVHQTIMKTILQCLEKRPGTLEELFTAETKWMKMITGFNSLEELQDRSDFMKRSRELISLNNLVATYCPHVSIPKDATLADWRIRPIANEAMIRYAGFDVISLQYVWQEMKAKVI